MAHEDAQHRKKTRRHMVSKVERLVDHTNDMAAAASPEERIALVDVLTREAWQLAGLPMPTYTRSSMPIAVRRLAQQA